MQNKQRLTMPFIIPSNKQDIVKTTPVVQAKHAAVIPCQLLTCQSAPATRHIKAAQMRPQCPNVTVCAKWRTGAVVRMLKSQPASPETSFLYTGRGCHADAAAKHQSSVTMTPRGHTHNTAFTKKRADAERK